MQKKKKIRSISNENLPPPRTDIKFTAKKFVYCTVARPLRESARECHPTTLTDTTVAVWCTMHTRALERAAGASRAEEKGREGERRNALAFSSRRYRRDQESASGGAREREKERAHQSRTVGNGNISRRASARKTSLRRACGRSTSQPSRSFQKLVALEAKERAISYSSAKNRLLLQCQQSSVQCDDRLFILLFVALICTSVV